MTGTGNISVYCKDGQYYLIDNSLKSIRACSQNAYDAVINFIDSKGNCIDLDGNGKIDGPLEEQAFSDAVDSGYFKDQGINIQVYDLGIQKVDSKGVDIYVSTLAKKIAQYLWKATKPPGSEEKAGKEFEEKVAALIDAMNGAATLDEMREILNDFIGSGDKHFKGDGLKCGYKFTREAFKAFFFDKGSKTKYSGEDGLDNMVISSESLGISMKDYAKGIIFNVVTPDSNLYKFFLDGIKQWMTDYVPIKLTAACLKGIMIGDTDGTKLFENLKAAGGINDLGEVIDTDKICEAMEKLKKEGKVTTKGEEELTRKTTSRDFKDMFDRLSSLYKEYGVEGLNADELKALKMLAYTYCDNILSDSVYANYVDEDILWDGKKKNGKLTAAISAIDNDGGFGSSKEFSKTKFETAMVGKVLNGIRESVAEKDGANKYGQGAYQYMTFLSNKTNRNADLQGPCTKAVENYCKAGGVWDGKAALGKGKKAQDLTGTDVGKDRL